MGHRSYSIPAPREEAPTFDIEGESFVCKDEVLPSVWFAAMRGGDLIIFLSEAMEEAEFERFLKFVEDPGRKIPGMLVRDIARDVLREYSTDRPTKPSTES